MTFGQALLYFLREATLSLVRSWKVSLLAVLTIALSLYMGGFVLLVSQNLGATLESWSGSLKVLVYLQPDLEQPPDELIERARSAPWVSAVEVVSAAEATARFRDTFPSLADLFTGWEEEPLPASLEISLSTAGIEGGAELESWLEELRQHPATSMVDDDRDWIRQLEAVIAVVRTIGLTLGLTLLGAAVFTIAAVVKLTAYLYLDEIAVMRLVGATEFFIRGPFYTEGFLQGLVGGGVGLLGLFLTTVAIEPEPTAIWLPLVFRGFLPWPQQVGLVTFGALAGLIGAVLSLRRETLKPDVAD